MIKKLTILLAAGLLAAGAFAQPRLVAHRGGRYEVEENTLPAFASALEAGITGYELDVHITADGEYVIMHDSNVSRMCGSDGVIEKMTLAELRALKTLKGNLIPTLGEVLALFNRYEGIYVEFEMKTTSKDLYPENLLHKYAEDVVAAVYAAKPANSLYLCTSFDTRVLCYIHNRYPEVPLGYITAEGCTEKTRAIAATIGTNRLMCHRAKTTLVDMEAAHKEGMLINLWPNGSVEDVRLSYALGADYICTDIPRKVAAVIKEESLGITP